MIESSYIDIEPVELYHFIKKFFKKKMASQKFLEELFYKSIEPFVIIFQIFGCAPLNDIIYKPNTPLNKVKDLTHSILQAIWSLLLLILITVSTYFQASIFDTTLSFLSKVLYRLEYIFGLFNTALIIYGSQFKKKHFLKILKNLIKLEADLNELEEIQDFNFIRIFLKKTIFSYSLFFIAVIVVDCNYNKLQIIPFLRSSTVYTIPNILSLLSITQYCGILYCIQHKYKKINSCLFKLSKTCNYKSEVKQIINKSNVISIVSSKIIENYVKNIEHLRKTHSSLSCLTEDVNESFGILIISILASSFAILSIQFYALYKMFDKNDIDTFLFIYTVLWIILHGGKVAIILYANNGLSNEVSFVGQTLI